MAGKGDKWRPVDMNKFRANHDKIFSKKVIKKPTTKKVKQNRNKK